ncbi:MAG TPA: M23 family metallopeptidase [Candidatus Ozemobacteraceae bacterium]|nr:M23 family metallopeptidase [Candidatus Ozemobacteraceae bacterium]
MNAFNTRMVFAFLLLLLVAVTPVMAEDLDTDGFVPTTGTVVSNTATVNTLASQSATPSGENAQANRSSQSDLAEMDTLLQSFGDSLSRLLTALSNLFRALAGIFSNNVGEVRTPIADAPPASNTASTTPSTTAADGDRRSVLNDVRYGISRLAQRVQNQDPQAAATVAWVTPYLNRLKAFGNPADADLIRYADDMIRRAGSLPSSTTSRPPSTPTTQPTPAPGAGRVLPSGFVNPCPTGRISPYAGDDGCDIHAPVGTPVYAVKDGVVVYNDPSGHSAWEGPGNHTGAVRIRHADGTESWYAHLSGRNLNLKPGMQVKAGTLVGNVGIANNVPHLHISIFYSRGGDSGGFMDPFELADALRG